MQRPVVGMLQSSFAAFFLICAASASAATVNVSVINDAFSPASVTINVNDQVTWV